MPRDWGDPTSVMQPRQPAFWLLVGLTTIGVLRIGSMVGDAFRLYPTGSLLAVTLLTLYAIPFIAFVYRLDLFEREPVTMVAAAFAWGGLAATSLALSGNQAIFGLASKLGSPDFAGRWGPALAAPPIEETLKILGVVLLVLIARDQFDSPLDGMVYGALIGLGFQVVEDFIYCVNAITLAGGDGEIGPVLGTFVVRALVGLWSHATYTAIAGYGVGYVASRRDRKLGDRLLVAAGCFAVAYSAHFIWNSPILMNAFGEGAGILLGLVLKGIPVFVLLVVMYRLARRQEATWFRDAVAGEVGSDVLLREELDELMTLSSRRDVIKMVRRVRGKRAARLVGQLQHAQLELGLACSRRGATGGAGRGRRPPDHPAAARRAGAAGRGASGHAAGLGRRGRGARWRPGGGRPGRSGRRRDRHRQLPADPEGLIERDQLRDGHEAVAVLDRLLDDRGQRPDLGGPPIRQLAGEGRTGQEGAPADAVVEGDDGTRVQVAVEVGPDVLGALAPTGRRRPQHDVVAELGGVADGDAGQAAARRPEPAQGLWARDVEDRLAAPLQLQQRPLGRLVGKVLVGEGVVADLVPGGDDGLHLLGVVRAR